MNSEFQACPYRKANYSTSTLTSCEDAVAGPSTSGRDIVHGEWDDKIDRAHRSAQMIDPRVGVYEEWQETAALPATCDCAPKTLSMSYTSTDGIKLQHRTISEYFFLEMQIRNKV